MTPNLPQNEQISLISVAIICLCVVSRPGSSVALYPYLLLQQITVVHSGLVMWNPAFVEAVCSTICAGTVIALLCINRLTLAEDLGPILLEEADMLSGKICRLWSWKQFPYCPFSAWLKLQSKQPFGPIFCFSLSLPDMCFCTRTQTQSQTHREGKINSDAGKWAIKVGPLTLHFVIFCMYWKLN